MLTRATVPATSALHKISSAQASSTKDRDLVMTRFSDRALVIVEAEPSTSFGRARQGAREERLQRQQHRDCLRHLVVTKPPIAALPCVGERGTPRASLLLAALSRGLLLCWQRQPAWGKTGHSPGASSRTDGQLRSLRSNSPRVEGGNSWRVLLWALCALRILPTAHPFARAASRHCRPIGLHCRHALLAAARSLFRR